MTFNLISTHSTQSADQMIRALINVEKSLERPSLEAGLFENEFTRRPFYIHVESRQVKRDRLNYTDNKQSDKAKELTAKRKKSTRIRSKAKAFKKSFHGAPFSAQSSRFSTKGLHPMLLPSMNTSSTLSPCSYRPYVESQTTAEKLLCNTSWKSERYHRNAALTEQQKKNKMVTEHVEHARGPGLYTLPPITDQKSFSNSDTSFLRASRLADEKGEIRRTTAKHAMIIPGPGTYDAKFPAIGTATQLGKSYLENSLGHRAMCSTTDSGLAPCRYNTDQAGVAYYTSKRVGKLGPYRTFTTNRWDRLCTGSPRFQTAQQTTNHKNPNLGPGAYSPKYPELGKKANHLRVTEESRLLKMRKSTKEGHPFLRAINDTPGPGSYEAPTFIQAYGEDTRVRKHASGKVTGISAMSQAKANRWYDKYGFLSTTKKKDKITVDIWQRYGNDSLGPGRYDIARCEKKMQNQAEACGHKSVFQSKLPQNLQTACVEQLTEVMRKRKDAAFDRNQIRLERMITMGHAKKSRLLSRKLNKQNTGG